MTKHLHASRVHVGNARNHQEDGYHVDEEGGLFVVLDGMGGHSTGYIATEAAIRDLCDKPRPRPTCFDDIRTVATSMHQAIRDHVAAQPRTSGQGATAALAWIEGDLVWVAWVGDARVYAARDGELTQLTIDHRLPTVYQRISMLEEEFDRYNNVIIRSLGIYPTLDVSVSGWRLRPGDRLLLSTDGLHDHLTSEELSGALSADAGVETVAQNLLDLVLETEARDNICLTVVEPHVRAPEPPQDLPWGPLRAALHAPSEDAWHQIAATLEAYRGHPSFGDALGYAADLLPRWPKTIARRPLETWLFHGQELGLMYELCDTLWVPQDHMLTPEGLERLMHEGLRCVDLSKDTICRRGLRVLLSRDEPWARLRVDTEEFKEDVYEALLEAPLAPWAHDWVEQELDAGQVPGP